MLLRFPLAQVGACLSVLLSASLGASIALASFPVVQRCEPMGIVRGEEATVVFHGERLNDACSAILDLPGMEVLEVTPIDGKQVTVKIKADKNLAPGLYPIRLVTHSGIANVRLLGVGSMPIVPEAEPNNQFDSPQKITLDTSKKKYGVTIEGVVTREDVDHYQVHLKKGQRLTAEIEGIRLLYSIKNAKPSFDPYIAILDAGRFEVASSDDSSLLAQDGVCSFVAPEDGDYTVLVRESSFGGNKVCGYRLHVGGFPRPIAALPGGGVPGSTLTAKLIAIDGSHSDATVQLPSEAKDRWGVVTEDETGISPSPNWVRVNILPVMMEKEKNGNHRKAPVYPAVPAAFCGVLAEPNEFDCFAFPCKKGQKFRVQCYARNILRSPLDAVINVFAPDFKTIISSDDVGTSKDPSVEFTAAADGNHILRIYDHLRSGSSLHHYRIEVVKANPTFDLSLKELRRDEASVASVPIGGHTAVMAMVSRKGYGGEIHVAVEGLPKGVTAKTFPLPAGRGEIPVLLSAAADAKETAVPYRLTGKGDAKNKQVVGVFKQTHKLVLGQNRRSLFNYDTTSAAIAVTEKAPFTIELSQPQTPIVRQGSKSLQVKIVRDEGFDAAVQFKTLYNPPGIGVNNSLKIKKAESEVAIPITANAKAALGNWPIILVASYPGKHGTVQVTTPAIMLEVKEDIFAYKFPMAAAEQGTDAMVSVELTVKKPYDGEAEIELVGLPNGITSKSAKQKVAPDATVINFPIQVAKDAKPGKHKTLVCIARIKVGEETIVQTTGTGQLRIDKPLPPKKAAAKPAAKPVAKPVKKKPAKPAAPKPLSRLEQLRQMKGE